MKVISPTRQRKSPYFIYAFAIALPLLVPRPSVAQECAILSFTSEGALTFWASATNLSCGLQYRAGPEAQSCWHRAPGSFWNFTNKTLVTTIQIPVGDIESDRVFFRVACSTNHSLIPPAVSIFSSWEVVDCILTNNATEALVYEASPIYGPKGVVVVYGVWTNGLNDINSGYIAALTGPSLSSLTRHGPVFQADSDTNAWDSGFVSPGRIYTENGTNFMFYFASTNKLGFEGGYLAIGVAYSTNGLDWTRGPNNPIIEPFYATTAGTNFVKCYVMSCLKVGDKYFGFYNGTRWLGNGHVREEIVCAYADNILGPWTATPQKPIIVNSNGLDSVVADPVVFPLNEGGWGMTFREWYTGQKSRPAFAWSCDLTNWFGRDLNGNYGVTWNSSHPLVVPGTTELYGSGFLEDAGPAMLMDDLTHIYLLRPSKVPDCNAPVWRMGGGDNVRAYLRTPATYP